MFDINFEIVIFLLLYLKNAEDENSNISTLFEAFHLKKITFDRMDIYKKDDINKFLKDIFNKLEENKEAWPFNEIQKFEKKRIEDLKMTLTEIKFIEILLGYYSNYGSLEDFKIFHVVKIS